MKRRDFLRSAGLALGGSLAAGLPWSRAGAAGLPGATLRLGLVLPAGARTEGVRRGVQMGVEEANRTAQLFGTGMELVEATAGEAPAAAAERLVREQGIFALLGGLDDGGAAELGRVADARHVLFLNLGAPSDALRAGDCRRFTFHVAASAAMLSDAVADGLAGPAFPRRWFFIRPPTVEGTALFGRGRAALLRAGGRAMGRGDIGPAVTDFAPVLRDAQRAGADGVWSVLAGQQQLGLVAAYRALAPDYLLAGPLLDEPAFRALPAERRAGTWPALWYHERKPFGAGSLSARFQERFGQPMDSDGWAGWVAPKILLEATQRARSSDPAALVTFLESERAQFDGHKGVPLSFRPWDHQLRQPLYLLRPVPRPPNDGDIFEVVAELPRRAAGAGAASTTELLDRLGDGASASGCRAGGQGTPPAPPS